MTLIAVSKIDHGKSDGTVKTFNIGDTVSGLDEEQERALVAAGSVVETGERKYTTAATAGPVDEDTRKRDEILAKAAMGEDIVNPAVTGAVASESTNAAAENEPARTGTGTAAPTIGAATVPVGGATTTEGGAIESDPKKSESANKKSEKENS